MSSWLRLYQLWQLTAALFREIIREPGVIFWGIVFPILMSLGLGLAFTQKPDVLRKVAVIAQSQDHAGTADSSEVINFMETHCEKKNSGDPGDYKWKFIIKDEKLGNSIFLFYEMELQEAMIMLKRGTVNIVITETGSMPEYHFDPQNSDAQLTYLKLNPVIGTGRVAPEGSNQNIKPLTVTGTRYIDFLVPGLMTMGIMMSCMWGISYGLIEKRSKKLLRRLVATPGPSSDSFCTGLPEA